MTPDESTEMHTSSGSDSERSLTAEHRRLAAATGRAEDDLAGANPWYEWGPYLSERAWGTATGAVIWPTGLAR
jgi:hypothetical protein